MEKKLKIMNNSGKGVKVFEIPPFESWISAYKLHENNHNDNRFFRHTSTLGDYFLQIGQTSYNYTDKTSVFGIGIACGTDKVFNIYIENIFISYIKNVDMSTKEGLKEFKNWYDAKTIEANKTFLNYMQKNYFSDEKQQENEMDNVR